MKYISVKNAFLLYINVNTKHQRLYVLVCARVCMCVCVFLYD